MTKYTCGISDGMNWNAGGQTTFTARTVREARAEAESWADDGDYPCDGPITVTLVLRSCDSWYPASTIARWSHEIPAERYRSERGQ